MKLDHFCGFQGNRYEATHLPVTSAPAEKADAPTAMQALEKKDPTADNRLRFMTKTLPIVTSDDARASQPVLKQELDRYCSTLQSLEARRHLALHDVTTRMNVLSMLSAASPPSADETAPIAAGKQAKTALPEPVPAGELASYRALVDALLLKGYDTASSREICAELAKAIGVMSDSYLDVFQQAVEKNAAFYQDFSDFMSKLKNFVEAKDDKTILKANEFRAELDKLINKYPVPGQATTLFPVQSGGTLTGGKQDECIAWAKEMGLNPDNCVKRLSNGTYVVVIDVTPLQKIKDSVPAQDKMECNSAQWAAWQTGLDMQKDTIQTGMQTLTQKYSNANSTFDNLIKILSSTISSLLECDKAFLHI